MAVQRMDNVAIVVDDLDAAIRFFTEIGLSLDGRALVEGEFADTCVGLDGVRSEIAMMVTPDGHSKIELTRYLRPEPISSAAPYPNTIGLHRVMFAVDDLDATLARLEPLGGRVLRAVASYQDLWRLCYLRGPSGIIVALAEQVG